MEDTTLSELWEVAYRWEQNFPDETDQKQLVQSSFWGILSKRVCLNEGSGTQSYWVADSWFKKMPEPSDILHNLKNTFIIYCHTGLFKAKDENKNCSVVLYCSSFLRRLTIIYIQMRTGSSTHSHTFLFSQS